MNINHVYPEMHRGFTIGLHYIPEYHPPSVIFWYHEMLSLFDWFKLFTAQSRLLTMKVMLNACMDCRLKTFRLAWLEPTFIGIGVQGGWAVHYILSAFGVESERNEYGHCKKDRFALCKTLPSQPYRMTSIVSSFWATTKNKLLRPLQQWDWQGPNSTWLPTDTRWGVSSHSTRRCGSSSQRD